jgi:hypothetical protein
MGFPAAERRYAYAPSLLDPPAGEPAHRRYFVGALDGSDGGRLYDFDQP